MLQLVYYHMLDAQLSAVGTYSKSLYLYGIIIVGPLPLLSIVKLAAFRIYSVHSHIILLSHIPSNLMSRHLG